MNGVILMIDETKINLAKDIIFNSSDIETISALYYLKRINEFKEELLCNRFNIKKLDRFIKECIDNYLETKNIIQESDNTLYLYKKDYYLKRLQNIEIGIYTHILIIKRKIDNVYEEVCSI